MTLVHTDQSKYALKNMKNYGRNLEKIIRSTTSSSENLDEKCMKTRFNSDDDLPLKKTIELHNIITVVRSLFNDGSKHYSQIFLDIFTI